MKKDLKKLFEPFAPELQVFEQHFADIMTSEVKLVDQVAKYIVKHKGKQFRPRLVIVAASAAGDINQSSYTTAAVVELLHTASLVHDDVLDASELRRGYRTIHKIWKNKIAILMGDYLLARALIAATDTGSLQIMNSVANVAKRLIQGAIFEIQKTRKPDLDEEDYFRLIGDKTASLIAACCELGALSVDAPPEVCSALRSFGERLGLTFQIKDDLLDYEANSGILGKPALADLQDKKVTLPLIYALRSAPPEQRNKVLKQMRKGPDKNDLQQILAFVKEHRGIELARRKAADIKEQAIEHLQILPDNKGRQTLEALADFVLNRTK